MGSITAIKKSLRPKWWRLQRTGHHIGPMRVCIYGGGKG